MRARGEMDEIVFPYIAQFSKKGIAMRGESGVTRLAGIRCTWNVSTSKSESFLRYTFHHHHGKAKPRNFKSAHQVSLGERGRRRIWNPDPIQCEFFFERQTEFLLVNVRLNDEKSVGPNAKNTKREQNPAQGSHGN